MKKKGKTIKRPEAKNYMQLAEIAGKEPDRIAYKFDGKKITYRELLRNVDRLAMGLKRVDIKRGDKVLICLPDIPQAVECYYAIDKEGIRSWTLHPDTKPQAIAVIAEEMNSKAIVTVDEHYEGVSKAIAGLDHSVQIILADVKIKKPKTRIKKTFLRKVMGAKYAKDEYLTLWSQLIGQ